MIKEVEHALYSSSGLQELEHRAVHLKMKEDEQKLSFKKGGATASTKQSGMMQYNSSGNIRDYGERDSIPTRGQTHGMGSQMNDGYDGMSYIRSSQRSGIQKSDAFKSGMHAYASTGVQSGMSRREGYTTHQAAGYSFKSPGVSRLP